MSIRVAPPEEDTRGRTTTRERDGETTLEARLADTRRSRIDVTEMDARSVQQFARQNVGTDRVSLEHRGARTYLVVEE